MVKKPKYGEVYRDPVDGETVMILNPSEEDPLAFHSPTDYWDVLSMCWGEDGSQLADQPVETVRRLDGWEQLE